MPSTAVQVPPEVAQRAQQGAADAAAGQQAGEGGGPDQEPYLVPACAAWFRWDGIADVEEAHFKDFLAADPAANPERYREYRNAIINQYRWGSTVDRHMGSARMGRMGAGGWARCRLRARVALILCARLPQGPACHAQPLDSPASPAPAQLNGRLIACCVQGGCEPRAELH